MKPLTEEALSLVEFRAKNAGDEDVLDLLTEVREHRRAASGVHPRLQQAMGEAVAETIVELQQECIAAKSALRRARDAALEEEAVEAKSMGLGWCLMRSVKMTNHADAAGKIEDAIRALKSKREDG